MLLHDRDGSLTLKSWLQSKTIETTLEALADDSNSTLPPLMNPTMLEASDDLTNLSHLNEPAGMTSWVFDLLISS